MNWSWWTLQTNLTTLANKPITLQTSRSSLVYSCDAWPLGSRKSKRKCSITTTWSTREMRFKWAFSSSNRVKWESSLSQGVTTQFSYWRTRSTLPCFRSSRCPRRHSIRSSWLTAQEMTYSLFLETRWRRNRRSCTTKSDKSIACS